MSLQVIGVGFGRTGTLSLQHALHELGYPCYHMFEVLENKNNSDHLDFWHTVSKSKEGEQHNWETVFAQYTATVDNPGCCVWRELIEAYPNAKVILSHHPKGPESWYDSTFQTIYASEYLWQFKVLRLIPKVKKMTNMTRNLIWKRSLKNTMQNKAFAIARYHEHTNEVKQTVPGERLLIFNASMGWEPLCQFLDKPVPNKKFPNVNDREQIRKTISKISYLAYLLIGSIALFAVGVLYFALR